MSVKTDTTYYDTTNSSSVISKTKYNDKVVYVGYSDGTTESYSYYDDGELMGTVIQHIINIIHSILKTMSLIMSLGVRLMVDMPM